MRDKYSEIINQSYPFFLNMPRMSMHDRAAQFSSFAALNGHSDAILETARLTDRKIELDEQEKENLDFSLSKIQYMLDKGLSFGATIVYFINDEKKSGGRYERKSGEVKKIDDIEKSLVLSLDEKEIIQIHLDDIIYIKPQGKL